MLIKLAEDLHNPANSAFFNALRTQPELVKAWEVLNSVGDVRRLEIGELQKVHNYFEATGISKADFVALYNAESNKLTFFRRCKFVDNIDFLKPFKIQDAFRVESPNVLSLGEGNFSFSASISDDISELNQAGFLATEYRTYEQLASANNIDQAQLDDALAFLSSNFVEFRFGVDGTNLPADIGNFDVVVFNFPWVNAANPVNATKEMLTGVITQMQNRLNSGGKLFITHKESWASPSNLNLESLSNGSITLIGDKKFSISDFPGYSHVVSNPNGGSANVTTGITYIFKKN